MKIKKNNILTFLEVPLVIISLLLVFFSLKEFNIWYQITSVLSMDTTVPYDAILLADLYFEGHPHFTRISLMYIFYGASKLFSLDVFILFNYIMPLFVFMIYKYMKSILEYSNTLNLIFILLFLEMLSIFMNGRIIFSILGNTMLLYLLYVYEYRNLRVSKIKLLVTLFFALWFISVSSGTFMVGLVAIFNFFIIKIMTKLPKINRKLLYILLGFLLLIIVISPLLTIFITKNLNYFDGSIEKMMGHGFGHYIFDFIIPIILLLFLLIYILIKLFKKNTLLILPLSMMISSLIIGVFGYSSFLSGISSFIIFIFFFKYKNKINYQLELNREKNIIS